MNIHNGEQALACSVCEKSFSRSLSLIVLMEIDAGEKPYPCQICNKSLFFVGAIERPGADSYWAATVYLQCL